MNRHTELIVALAVVVGVTASACHSDHPAGVVKGRLVAVGGPAPGSPRPLPGTVSFTGPEATSVSVGTEPFRSAFRRVPTPGTYKVQGHSPLYGGGTYTCSPMNPHPRPGETVVREGAATSVLVVCEEM